MSPNEATRRRNLSLVGAAGSSYAGLVGEDDHLDPVAQAELGQDASDVAFTVASLRVQPSGHLGLRQSLGHQLDHLNLARD